MIRNLSYVGFTSPAADAWRTFGPEVLGAQLASVGRDGGDATVRLRVDDASWRIAVHPGPTDDLAYLGWAVGDAGLDAAVDRLEAEGVDVHREPTGGDRPVAEVAWFVDPFGFRHELGVTPPAGDPFEPARPISGFVTGEQGLGHVVLIVPDLDAGLAFATDVLGLRLTDSVESGLSIRFLHCPGHAARHHSLAMASVPGMVGLHHLMLEVVDLDDVGTAYDLVRERGLPVAMDLGRHTNDRMTSFYVRSPSGFEVEVGTGGLLVDDDTWEVGTLDSQSTWGHHLPADGMLLPGILRPVAAPVAAP